MPLIINTALTCRGHGQSRGGVCCVVTGTGHTGSALCWVLRVRESRASVQFTLPIRQFVMCFKAFLNSVCGLAGWHHADDG